MQHASPRRPWSTPSREGHARRAVQQVTWFLATLATGLAAGFFYAWDVSVVRGTALVGDATYVETMRAVNQTVRNPAFFASFFGALAFGVLAIVVRLPALRSATARLIALGVACYLVAFVITVAVSVPLNTRLEEGTVSRVAYESPWNRANTARTVASTAGFVALLAAGITDARPRRDAH